MYQVTEYMEESLLLKDILKFFLKRLARRCSGAHTISQTVLEVVKAVAEGVNASTEEDFPTMIFGINSTVVGQEKTSALDLAKWKREAKILAISLSLCDPALEHNAVPDQSRVAEMF